MAKLPRITMPKLHWPATFTETRRTLTLKFTTLVAVTIIVFHQDLIAIFSNTLQDQTTFYIAAVPFIAIYLAYRKRKMLRAVIPLNSEHQPKNKSYLTPLSGLLLAVAAIALYWYGSYTFTPFAYHLFAMPLFLSGLVLILFNAQTLRQLAFPVAFLFFLVPPPPAIGVFILIFVGAILLILISENAFKTHILNKKNVICSQCTVESPSNEGICKECGRILHPSTAKLHRIDAAKIAAIFIIGLLITIQATTRALPITAMSTPTGHQYSNQILPGSDQYSLTYVYDDPSVDVRLHLDFSLGYKYEPLANESLVGVQVGLILFSDPLRLPPNDPGAGWYLNNQTNITSLGASYFVYSSSKSGEFQAYLLWNTSAVFMIGKMPQQKYVEIKLRALTPDLNELPAVKQQITALATLIINDWEPSEHWSGITLTISQNIIGIGTVTSLLLAAIIIYYASDARRQRKISLTAVSKLNSIDVEIVKALQTTKPAAIGNLAATLQKNMRQMITPEELEKRLKELEDVGIIRSQISSLDNTPIQTWKT